MDADAFLRAARADPENDLPRLVWADWLDDRDTPADAARAEFIRVQCELKRLPAHDPAVAALEDREHDLLAAHELEWLGDLGMLAEWTFRRGLVDEVRLDPADLPATTDFERHAVTAVTFAPRAEVPTADAIFALHGLEGLRELDATPASRAWTLASLRALVHDWDAPRLHTLQLAGLSGLAGLPQLLRGSPVARNLRRLQVGGLAGSQAGYARVQNDALDPAALAKALRHAPLESLTVYDANLTSVAPLLTAAFAPTLKSLDVSYNPLEPRALDEFSLASAELKLTHLDVSGTVLCNTHLPSLLRWPCCATLTALALNNPVEYYPFWLQSLFDTPFWHQAEELSAHRAGLLERAIEWLSRTAGPPGLRSLDLGENALGSDGVALLAVAPWARSLTWLNLSANRLGPLAAENIAASGAFPHLRTLHVGHNNRDMMGDDYGFDDTAVESLVRSPTLGRLRVLTLTANPVTSQAVPPLLDAPFTLSGLGLGQTELTPLAARYLADAPKLARLNWLDLSGNPRLHSDALLPLAESPYLSPLCELDISGTGASDTVRDLLRQRLGRRLMA